MLYGKIDSGYLVTPTERCETAEEYIALGYKPVEYTPVPILGDGNYPVVGWEEQSVKIIQTWLQEQSDEPTAEDALNILLGGAL